MDLGAPSTHAAHVGRIEHIVVRRPSTNTIVSVFALRTPFPPTNRQYSHRVGSKTLNSRVVYGEGVVHPPRTVPVRLAHANELLYPVITTITDVYPTVFYEAA
jgi:hypothetical protein